MNENDKPRGDRRRSSRGRRRRSGGGDRSNQPVPQENTNQPKARSVPEPSAPNERTAEGGRRRDGRRRNKRGGERAPDRQSAPKEKQNKPVERAAPPRNGGDAARPAAAAALRDRFAKQRIVPVVLPRPVCPRCGSLIEDLASALNDKESGAPMHFDCVLARLAEAENIGEGEKVVYLGGGRFGVVQFETPGDQRKFRIRKTLQWEEKEKRADWRRQVADLYSST